MEILGAAETGSRSGIGPWQGSCQLVRGQVHVLHVAGCPPEIRHAACQQVVGRIKAVHHTCRRENGRNCASEQIARLHQCTSPVRRGDASRPKVERILCRPLPSQHAGLVCGLLHSNGLVGNKYISSKGSTPMLPCRQKDCLNMHLDQLDH